MKITFLENALLEDKQIKLGGEVNPKYGWCVIYAGGSASGKSTATGFNLPFVGKKLDVDEFKDPEFLKQFVGGKYYDRILNSKEIGGDESRMNLNDEEYPEVAHKKIDDFSEKMKKIMTNLGKYNSPDRLPNIILDQTTKNIFKLRNQVITVKKYGYKVAIVYVLTDMSENLHHFHLRNKQGRNLSPKLFFDIHTAVTDTILEIFDDNDMLSMLDDFWVVVNKYNGFRTPKQKLAQIKDTNVYHVPLEPDGLKQTHFITLSGRNKDETLYDMIIENKKFLKSYTDLMKDPNQM